MQYIALEDTLRPPSQDELRARALFLTRGLGEISGNQLREYIDHCDQPAAQVEQGAEHRRLADILSLNMFHPVIKELLCLNIWLIFIEVSSKESELPEWFHEYLILCHAIADKIYAIPTAQEIKQKYPLTAAPPEICMTASINLCMQLDLGNTRDDAMIHLGSLLERDLKARTELFSAALTTPFDTLKQITDRAD